MRNNHWLEQELNDIWKRYFSDIEKLNNIHIVFGRKARRRLGSIRQLNRFEKSSDTEIKITGFFKSEDIPEYIVDLTIAHELCHYAHGFASPLPKFSRFPHRGDIVDRELKARGLEEPLKLQEKWLKDNWNNIVGGDIFARKHARVRRIRRKRTPLLSFIRKFVFNS